MSGKRSRAELLANLRRVGREHSDATVLFHSALASEIGLHPTDYKALGVLDRLGPMSAGDLGRHTGLAAASVTNLIDRLVAKGFLRREPDPPIPPSGCARGPRRWPSVGYAVHAGTNTVRMPDAKATGPDQQVPGATRPATQRF